MVAEDAYKIPCLWGKYYNDQTGRSVNTHLKEQIVGINVQIN